MPYEHAFTPLDIGPVRTRNRIFYPPCGTYRSPDGIPNEQHGHVLEARARGGAGIVYLEALRNHPTSLPTGEISGFDARIVPHLQNFSERVHQHGALFFTQLLHHGSQVESTDTELPVLASSEVPSMWMGEVPHVLRQDELDEVRSAFVRSADLSVRGGADGMEIHAAHGFLLHNFLSPLTNTRSDEYGGSQVNRSRLLREVCEQVREVALDRAVGVRLSATEFEPGGLQPEDQARLIVELADEDLIDFASISVGGQNFESFAAIIPDATYGRAPFVDFAGRIRELTEQRIPIFTVGRILEAREVEEIVATGQADMVGMGRALFADPELPNKSRAGNEADVVPCIGCNQGCAGRVLVHKPATCVVNPWFAMSKDGVAPSALVADDPQRVAVIGGGPGGLAAAVRFAERGAEVNLYERRSWLGGQLELAGRIGRTDLTLILDHWRERVAAAGVATKLEVEADAETIAASQPHLVVLATGSRPKLPDVPLDRARTSTTWEIAEQQERLDGAVVLFDPEGSYQGADVALFLADNAEQVTLVSPYYEPVAKVPLMSKPPYHRRFREKGVTFVGSARLDGFEDGTVRLGPIAGGDLLAGHREQLEADHLVIVPDRQPDSLTLVDDLASTAPRRLIGDAVAPRTLLEAIRDGHRVGEQGLDFAELGRLPTG